MNIENHLHIASEISSSPADVETLDTYEDRIHYYKSRNYTYIPMPKNMKYYDTEQGWQRDLDDDQIIMEDTHLMEVLRKMQRYPFLLIDYMDKKDYYVIEIGGDIRIFGESMVDLYSSDFFLALAENIPNTTKEDIEEKVEGQDLLTAHEVRDNYPEVAQEFFSCSYEDQYGIITLVDLNSRGVKQMLYKVISQLASELAMQIESEYPESEDILKHLRPVTIGRWEKDKIQGLEMHISEHMNLIEMMQVIQSSDGSFVRECGFESKKDVGTLNKINKIRNRVMHANRSLIYDRKNIDNIIEVVNESERILEG